MKNVLYIGFLSIVCAGHCYGGTPTATSSTNPPLVFLENKGQWQNNVLFKAEIPRGAAIFFENNCITFNIVDTNDMLRILGDHHKLESYKPTVDYRMHFHAFKMQFINATTVPETEGTDLQTEYSNFFIGNIKSKWASKVREFHSINYNGLYPSINLKITSQENNLKYLYEIQPGADLNQLAINFIGTDGLALDDDGDLLIKTSIGTLMDLKPYAYQMQEATAANSLRPGTTTEIPCTFSVRGNIVSYKIAGRYNKALPLYIDPTLMFSTYSGSTADNFGYTATYDSKGNAFEAGSVFGIGYPVTPGAYLMHYIGGDSITFSDGGKYPGDDIGISKFSADGTQRIFATYLGGYGEDLPHSLIANVNDELIVLGTTGSANYPTTSTAYDTVFNGGPNPGVFDGIAADYENGSDIVISRFSADGSQLLASTYVGGSDNDGLNYAANRSYSEAGFLRHNYADEVRGDIELDNNGNIYVASSTRSTDFPRTPGSAQSSFGGGQDACIFKMDANLTTMIWSTTIGGSDDDAGYSLAIDNDGNLFMAGGTRSLDFPVTAGTLQTTYGGGDADGYILHIDKNGQKIIASSYWGFGEYDQNYFVQLDKANHVFVFGQADSSANNYIINAAYNKPNGGEFITKFNEALDTVIWSTSFGRGLGVTDISPTAFLVDVCNNVYACGWGSQDINNIVGGTGSGTEGLQVTSNAYKQHTPGHDFYLMVMEGDASALSYATFMGGLTSQTHVDGGTSRFDKSGVAYESVCAGCGGYSDFPTTPGAAGPVNASPNCNNLVFKFDLNLPLCLAAFSANNACTNAPITFVNQSDTVSTPVYQWFFGDGSGSSQTNPVHSYTQTGEYTVTLIVSDTGSCNLTDTISKPILVIGGNKTDTLPTEGVCNGLSIQIGITPVTDTSFTYQWSPASSLSVANISNPTATPLQSTTYSMIVTNGTCVDTFYQQVLVFKDSLAIQGEPSVCANDTESLSVRDFQPNQQFTYNWQPANLIVAGANTANPVVRPSQNTEFTVTAIDQVGCVYVDSIQIQVAQSSINETITASPDTITLGDSSQLNLKFSSNVLSYLWKPDSTLSSLTITNPFASPEQTNTYYAEVTDSQNCLKEDSITIYVEPVPCSGQNLFIPNAFSPNGDGKNDVLYVRGNGITNVYFAVYDRWGQKVFETKDITKGWDGTYEGQKLDAAVFGYYAEGECASGEKFKKQGNVTLLR